MEQPPIVCPECSATYRHPGRAGRTKCRACGTLITVAAPAGSRAASEPGGSPAGVVRAAPRAAHSRAPAHRASGARSHQESRKPTRRGALSPAVITISLLGLVSVVILIIVTSRPAANEPDTSSGPQSKVAQTGDPAGSAPDPWADPPPGAGSAPPAASDPHPDQARGAQPRDESQPGAAKGSPPPKRPGPRKRTVKPRAVALERYRNLEVLQPVPDCPAETRSKILELITKSLDDTYPRDATNAGFALRELGKNAIPLLINAFLKLDLESVDRALIIQGNKLNEILQDIVHTRRSFDDRNEDAEGVRNRLRCRYFWHRWWKKEGKTWQPPTEEDG